MSEATNLICSLIAKGVTSREIILDTMVKDLPLTTEEAIRLMDLHRDIMEMKVEILLDPSMRKLK